MHYTQAMADHYRGVQPLSVVGTNAVRPTLHCVHALVQLPLTPMHVTYSGTSHMYHRHFLQPHS